MKKVLKLQILITMVLALYTTNVYATENKEYKIGDHVYYNPVSNTSCNYKNYWTTANQNGTCYRFLVVEDSEVENDTLKLMLTHDIALDTYDNYQVQLNNVKKNWTRYSGEINLISENEVVSLMRLNRKPGFNTDGTAESIHSEAGAIFLPFKDNTEYYLNGNQVNTAGFWTNTVHESKSLYAYSVTENANNKPLLRSEKRGIRPVITVKKSLVTDDRAATSLSIAETYKYPFLDKKFDGYKYKQMQGFTMANNKLFFYANNNSNPNKGVLLGYGGTNYNTSLGYLYGNMGHGNDMTYNSKTDKILITSADQNTSIWEFEPKTFTSGATNVIKIKEKIGRTINGIGYDKVDNKYFMQSSGLIVATDKNFTKIDDTFSAIYTEITQGIDYHNGYIYVSTFDFGKDSTTCPGKYQTYCYGEPDTGVIYVYNAKYNSDGTLSPNFGRLVATYKTPTGIGELETLSFKDDKLYLGYAAKKYDSENVFKVYASSTNVLQNPTYSIKYDEDKAIITSVEDISPVSGWTLSNDKKTLSKKLTSSDTSVNICDRYENCKKETLKTLDTITFSDNTTTYTGNKIVVDNATSKSNSEITYKYYSDNACTTEIDEIVNAGTYSVKAISAGNSNYSSNSKCAKLVVNKGNPIITLKDTDADYNGVEIVPNLPTAKAPNNKTDVNLEYTYDYYSDNTCKTVITTAPINAGTYYVKANSKATNNLNASSSACAQVKINKVNPTLTIEKNIEIPLNVVTSINFNTTSSGVVMCKSSSEEIVSCKIENAKLVLTPKTKGNTNITLIQAADINYNEMESTVNVSVNDITYDRVKPTITFTPTEDNNYTKTKSIKVSITDNETYIPSNQVLYYAITNSNTNAPIYEKSLTLTKDSRTQLIEIPSSDFENLTGTYYIWIKSGIKDANNNETVETISKNFNFNNTKPEVIGYAIRSKNQAKINVNIKSLSKIKSKSYSFSPDGVFTNFTKNEFTIGNVTGNKVYISVTDELDQSTVAEINIEDEERPILESYVLNSDGTKLENNLIDINNKTILYNLRVKVPRLEKIFEKYKKFEIKTKIDKNIKFTKDNVKIFNKVNEDVTSNFSISEKYNNIVISSLKVTDSLFYNEIYTVKIQASIKDDYKPEADGNKLASQISLLIDDKEIDNKEVTSQVKADELENVPNTSKNFNKIIISFGLIFVLIGGFVVISQLVIAKKDYHKM